MFIWNWNNCLFGVFLHNMYFMMQKSFSWNHFLSISILNKKKRWTHIIHWLLIVYKIRNLKNIFLFFSFLCWIISFIFFLNRWWNFLMIITFLFVWNNQNKLDHFYTLNYDLIKHWSYLQATCRQFFVFSL